MKNKLQLKRSSSFLWSVSFFLVAMASSAFAANDSAAVAAMKSNNKVVADPAVPITVTGPVSITNFSASYAASSYTYPGSTTRQYRFKVKNMTTNAEVISAAQNSQYYTIPASLRAWSTSFEISAAAVIDNVDFPFSGPTLTATSVGIPAIVLAPATCGATLSSFSFSLASNAAPVNPTLYRFRLRLASTPGGPYYYYETPTRFARITDFVGLTPAFNTTYSVAVQYDMTNNGGPLTAAYGAECNVSSPTLTTTFAPIAPLCAGSPSPLQNNSLEAVAGTWSPAYDAWNTTTYFFTPSSVNFSTTSIQVVITPQPVWYQDADSDGFGNAAVSQSSCTQPGGYVANSTDCDDTMAAVNPAATEICWNNIDDNCDGTKSEGCTTVAVYLNNPVILTNMAFHMTAVEYTYDGAVTKHYRYEVTNMTTGAVVQFDKTDVFSRYYTIPLSIRAFNTVYSIRAAAIIDGEALPYAGPSILVTTGPAFTVKLIASSCGTTLASNNSTIVSTPGFNTAFSYEFRMRPASTMDPYVYATSSNIYLSFGAFAGVQSGTTYEVSVRYAYLNNSMTAFSDWGAPCLVTTPGAPPIPRELGQGDSLASFSAVAYPNPFNDGFQLNVKSNQDSEVSVTVFDMVGRMIESRSSNVGKLESLTIGSNYPAGVYNVIVTQGAEKKTVRVIKR